MVGALAPNLTYTRSASLARGSYCTGTVPTWTVVGPRTVVAKRRDACPDETRVNRLETVVVQAALGEVPTGPTVDHDVGAFQKALQLSLPGGGIEVQDNRPLAQIVGKRRGFEAPDRQADRGREYVR